ncbi:MAG: hypothetical protein QW531_04905 [Thermoplasmata archaeon]
MKEVTVITRSRKFLAKQIYTLVSRKGNVAVWRIRLLPNKKVLVEFNVLDDVATPPKNAVYVWWRRGMIIEEEAVDDANFLFELAQTHYRIICNDGCLQVFYLPDWLLEVM